jgi:hypothetical protein
VLPGPLPGGAFSRAIPFPDGAIIVDVPAQPATAAARTTSRADAMNQVLMFTGIS